MKLKTLTFTLALGLAAAATCWAADEKIEKTLRDLDAQWSAAAGAKDLDKTVSYYAKDAVVLAPNHKMATTAKAIRTVWKESIDNAVSGSWKTSHVEIAQSGDMAFTTGTYKWTGKDTNGKESTEHGKYLAVWAKQADGTWKCTADAWNADAMPKP